LTLKELYKKLADDNPHLKKGVIMAAVKAILDEMKAALKNGDTVSLHGFGRFKQTLTANRKMDWLPEESKGVKHTTIRFYPSKVLVERINKQ